MDAVKIAIGCSVLALVVGSGLSRLPLDTRQSLLDSARAAIGGSAPSSARAPQPFRPSAPTPLAQTVSTGGEVIAADARGQFETTVEIEGERVPVLIDTGATLVALSFEDADRLGIRPLPSDFRMPISTANGQAYAAPVHLRSIRLGGIEIDDVSAIVATRGALSGTLLGMSFLSRLSTVSVDHGELVLRR